MASFEIDEKRFEIIKEAVSLPEFYLNSATQNCRHSNSLGKCEPKIANL